MSEYVKVKRRTFVIDHTPIRVDYLVVGTELPCDIYIRDKSTYQLSLAKGHKYNHIDKRTLQVKGISEVYVDYEVMDEVNKYKKKHQDLIAPLTPEKKFEKYTADKEKVYYAGRKLLIVGEKINFSLQVIRNLELQDLLKADEANPAEIKEEHVDNAHIIGDIVINKTDIKYYHQFINRLIKSESLSEVEKVMVKNWAIIENLKLMMDFLLNDPANREIIPRIKVVMGSFVNMISENLDNVPELLSKGLHNYFLNVHSVNVAVMATGLGLKSGIKPKEAQNLALGALLHDIGLSMVPSSIINKMGNLTDNEFQVYKNHVVEGEKLLKADKNIPDEAVIAAVQHHEKLSKRGYPFRLPAEKIKLYGRITAICDCYDAVTTRKPFKEPISSFEAMALLTKEADNYDPALIRSFIGMMRGAG
ncbi:MAG TPA: HD domain-containing phosphohydrolase [Dissulfurispiraceae bacterium]|nr:HD domain-containing phosphohydrolase [Dissulfurispiraceae bacterium]